MDISETERKTPRAVNTLYLGGTEKTRKTVAESLLILHRGYDSFIALVEYSM